MPYFGERLFHLRWFQIRSTGYQADIEHGRDYALRQDEGRQEARVQVPQHTGARQQTGAGLDNGSVETRRRLGVISRVELVESLFCGKERVGRGGESAVGYHLGYHFDYFFTGGAAVEGSPYV